MYCICEFFVIHVLIINIYFFLKLHVTIDNFLWKTFFTFDTYVSHVMTRIFCIISHIFYTGHIYMSLQNFKYLGKYESRVDACPQMKEHQAKVFILDIIWIQKYGLVVGSTVLPFSFGNRQVEFIHDLGNETRCFLNHIPNTMQIIQRSFPLFLGQLFESFRQD